MIGRVYRWRGATWRVVCRWSGPGPRNVLLERVEAGRLYWGDGPVGGTVYRVTGERVVRPFRGLRRVDRAAGAA